MDLAEREITFKRSRSLIARTCCQVCNNYGFVFEPTCELGLVSRRLEPTKEPAIGVVEEALPPWASIVYPGPSMAIDRNNNFLSLAGLKPDRLTALDPY